MSTDGVLPTTYYGRPLDDLTREELIEVAEHLGRRLETIRKSEAATLRLFTGAFVPVP